MALFRRRSVRTEEPTAKKRDWHRESPFRIPLRQDIWRRIRPESPDVDPLSGREQQVESWVIDSGGIGSMPNAVPSFPIAGTKRESKNHSSQ